MAKENAEATQIEAQKAPVARKTSRAEYLARALKRIQDAGNMTPKMQRNVDRFAAKINK